MNDLDTNNIGVITSTLPLDEVMKNLADTTAQVRAKLNLLNDLKKKIDDDKKISILEEENKILEPEITTFPRPIESLFVSESVFEKSKLSFSDLKMAVDILESIANIEKISGKNSISETSEKIRKRLNELLDR